MNVRYQEIAQGIARMVEVDQFMRERSHKEPGFWNDSVDRVNTLRMKKIVEEIGWPAISKVGDEAAHGAWLLVQHADEDVEFQRTCLGLMKQCVPSGDVRLQDVAFLEDRILVNCGKPQMYGTQFRQEGNRHIPKPIEDPEHVDERRAAMGLGTLQEGILHMYEKYQKYK